MGKLDINNNGIIIYILDMQIHSLEMVYEHSPSIIQKGWQSHKAAGSFDALPGQQWHLSHHIMEYNIGGIHFFCHHDMGISH